MLSQSQLAQLNQIRLEEDLTYRVLAKEIGIGFTKLHALLNTPIADIRINDRTAFKVQRFLSLRRSPRRTSGRRVAAR